MSPFDRPGSRTMDRAFALFGEAATYVDRAANAVPCTVLVERDLTRYGDQAATIAQHTALVQVRVSEVPEPPRRSETFQLAGGKVLTVDALQSSTEFLHRVMAS